MSDNKKFLNILKRQFAYQKERPNLHGKKKKKLKDKDEGLMRMYNENVERARTFQSDYGRKQPKKPNPLWKLIKSGVNNVGEGMNKSAELQRQHTEDLWSKRLKKLKQFKGNVKKNLDYQYGSFIKNLPFVNATKIKKELKNK
tara:strand:- start:696 stop:1124 length:429 start_codon:yes stop_codon:yes gene_type:complete